MAASFEGIVFDLDGTLVDSRIDFQGIRRSFGIPPGESILDWVAATEPSRRRGYERRLLEFELEAARRSVLFDGVSEVLEWLQGRGVRMAVLTRNTLPAWEVTRDRCGLAVFEIVVTRDTGLTKPHPASISPILEKWNVGADRLIHVGDFLYDLQLAEATGMYSILIHHPGTNPFEVGCDFVAVDHFELLAHLETLPFDTRSG